MEMKMKKIREKIREVTYNLFDDCRFYRVFAGCYSDIVYAFAQKSAENYRL